MQSGSRPTATVIAVALASKDAILNFSKRWSPPWHPSATTYKDVRAKYASGVPSVANGGDVDQTRSAVAGPTLPTTRRGRARADACRGVAEMRSRRA
jgi:hypothetical protein